MPKPLAQVTDVAALDAHTGTSARLAISVPPEWARETLTLVLDAPRLLPCERCQGGGCDGCERSGALRAPDDEAARRVDLTLPEGVAPGTLVRLPNPFGAHSIELIIVEVRFSAEPSPGVRRVRALRVPTRAPTASAPPVLWLLLVVLAMVVAVAIAVWRR